MDLKANRREIILGIFALLIGISAGYVAAWSTAPEDKTTYCEKLEGDLLQERQTDNLMCHKEDWVALAQSNQDIENRTDIKCVCTQVENGSLTIFPIRTPN